jgi:chromosome segregation ATPase
MSHLPPLPPSPGLSTPPALAAHLQDLQHQISTKTLALQTLQREYESLLAAFSRQQARYSTLDKKTKVSDIEIKTLTEEKIRLQSQVDALESQVEDLIKGKEESHQQSVASGAQYMQIMAMSSRLQAQGASDSRRWKAEKEKWEKEKQELTTRIKDLEAAASLTREPDVPQSSSLGVTRSSASVGFETHATSSATDDVLESTSLTTLRSEVVRLQKCCQNMESTLKGLGDEAKDLDNFVHKFVSFSRRLKDQTGRGRLQSQSETQTFQEQLAHTVDLPADLDG